MKTLTNKQKNRLFATFANEMNPAFQYGCMLCKHSKGNYTVCTKCEGRDMLELRDQELNAPYWSDVENILHDD